MAEQESTMRGWVVLPPKGDMAEFTFSITRSIAIKRYVSIWDVPDNWRAFYRRGYRCVRATRTITLEDKVMEAYAGSVDAMAKHGYENGIGES